MNNLSKIDFKTLVDTNILKSIAANHMYLDITVKILCTYSNSEKSDRGFLNAISAVYINSCEMIENIYPFQLYISCWLPSVDTWSILVGVALDPCAHALVKKERRVGRHRLHQAS